MQERLREIEAKYAELERKMAEPEYYSDAEAYAKLAKEQKELAPLARSCCRTPKWLSLPARSWRLLRPALRSWRRR